MINKFNNEYLNPTVNEEFRFLIKVILVFAIPAILTFLQPDTGVVLIYLFKLFIDKIYLKLLNRKEKLFSSEF